MHRAMRVTGLSAIEKCLLIHLAWYGDRYDTIRPSVQTLANEVGVTPKTIIRALATLEQGHHIAVTRSTGKVTNRYELWPNVVAESLNSSSTTSSREVEVPSSVLPSEGPAPSGPAPWESITPTPVKRSKRVRPGQIDDTPTPEEDSPVKRMKFKKPEEYRAADLARKWVIAVKGTGRGGELTYGAADSMMRGLLSKGAKPEDVYQSIDAWIEDPQTDSRLRTGQFTVWQDFNKFFQTFKSRQRRDSLVTGNDESSWEGYL